MTNEYPGASWTIAPEGIPWGMTRKQYLAKLRKVLPKVEEEYYRWCGRQNRLSDVDNTVRFRIAKALEQAVDDIRNTIRLLEMK